MRVLTLESELMEGALATDKREPNAGGATLFLWMSASFTILLFKLTDVNANEGGTAAIVVSLEEEEEEGAAVTAEYPFAALMLLPLLIRDPPFTVAAAFAFVRAKSCPFSFSSNSMKRLSGSQEYSDTGKFKLIVRQFEGPMALIRARSCALIMTGKRIEVKLQRYAPRAICRRVQK